MRTAAENALKSYREDHPDLDPSALDVNIDELVKSSKK